MSGLLHKTLISTSFIGITVLATSPAAAFTLQSPSLSGPALLYEQVGSSTKLDETGTADLATLLQGDINAPGGNIELSGMLGNVSAANFGSPTTLSGTLDGEVITVSSLTMLDWLNPYGGYSSFGQKWLLDAWTDSGVSHLVSEHIEGLSPNTDLNTLSDDDWRNLVTGFVGLAQESGARRFSDPNINYVNLEDDGTVSIGLAAHLEHESGIQLSEVVKVVYGGETHFLYEVGPALASGLVHSKEEDKEHGDGVSHTGLYNLTIPGEPVTDIPEPSTMLGLLAIGGLFGLTKRNKSNA
jgi:hypothetical protein